MQVALGLLLGLAGSVAWRRLFFTEPGEPALIPFDIFGAVAAGLILVTLGACAFPVRRATRLEPASVLRDQ